MLTDATAFTYETERRLTRTTDAEGKFTHLWADDADGRGRNAGASADSGTQAAGVACGS